MLTVGSTGTAVLFGSVIGVCLTSPDGSGLNCALSARWLRWCGRYSYAAYMFHMALIELLRAQALEWGGSSHQGSTSILNAIGFTAAVYALSFGAAWVSWNLWERHFIAAASGFSRQPAELFVPVEPVRCRAGAGRHSMIAADASLVKRGTGRPLPGEAVFARTAATPITVPVAASPATSAAPLSLMRRLGTGQAAGLRVVETDETHT